MDWLASSRQPNNRPKRNSSRVKREIKINHSSPRRSAHFYERLAAAGRRGRIVNTWMWVMCVRGRFSGFSFHLKWLLIFLNILKQNINKVGRRTQALLHSLVHTNVLLINFHVKYERNACISSGDKAHKAIVTFEICRERFTAIYTIQLVFRASDLGRSFVWLRERVTVETGELKMHHISASIDGQTDVPPFWSLRSHGIYFPVEENAHKIIIKSVSLPSGCDARKCLARNENIPFSGAITTHHCSRRSQRM